MKNIQKGPTITIVKSEFNHIFGGYTDISWQSPKSGHMQSHKGNSFLFVLYSPVQETEQPRRYKSKKK